MKEINKLDLKQEVSFGSRGAVYQHYKNKKLYEITGLCKIQENGEWIEAYIYREYGRREYFCRSEKEFKEKFALVK